MGKKTIACAGLGLVAASFLAVNVISGRVLRAASVDLTEDKLYTLAEGTKNLLGDIDEPLHLYYFFSEKVVAGTEATAIKPFANRVRELLEEFENKSGGNIVLDVLDPEPYSEEEERAVGLGLQGVPFSASGEKLYFGLAGTNSTDDEEVIPFFQMGREQFLEYDVAQMVHRLANPEPPVVGLITSLPVDGGAPNPMTGQGAEPWIIMEQVRRQYDVRTIAPTETAIPGDVSVLMLIHPKGLSDALLFAIDQYALGGGHVLAFVDGMCEADAAPPDPNNQLAAFSHQQYSDLGPLLGAWGVELATDTVAADRGTALMVNGGEGPIDCLVYLGLGQDNRSEGDLVTSDLTTVRMGMPGILTQKEGATTTFEKLLWTTEESQKVQSFQVKMGLDPKRLLDSFVSSGEELTLMARIDGTARTAFPDGKPKSAAPPEGEAPAEEAPSASLMEGKVHLILVADADMLQDRWWASVQNFFGQRIVSPTADNGNLVINALDNLAGSEDLISLRSRGTFTRPFDRVAELRREADDRYRDREQELEAKLQEAETKINELQREKTGADAAFLSDEQVAAIEEFQEEKAATIKELRKVKHSLARDVEVLGTKLKLANILLMPALIGLMALGLGFWSMNRKRS